jgi:hypothetical protein
MVSKPQYQEMPDHPPGNQAAATDAQRLARRFRADIAKNADEAQRQKTPDFTGFLRLPGRFSRFFSTKRGESASRVAMTTAKRRMAARPDSRG